jgi:hypothetical protein
MSIERSLRSCSIVFHSSYARIAWDQILVEIGKQDVIEWWVVEKLWIQQILSNLRWENGLEGN